MYTGTSAQIEHVALQRSTGQQSTSIKSFENVSPGVRLTRRLLSGFNVCVSGERSGQPGPFKDIKPSDSNVALQPTALNIFPWDRRMVARNTFYTLGEKTASK